MSGELRADWAEFLVERLRARASEYATILDPSLKRNRSIAMVAEIVGFLKAVPGIRDSDLYPLKDLFIFSEDLDHGRSHPWAKPVSVGGTNFESVAKTEIRIWAVIACLALIEADWKPKAAVVRVAQHLRESGRPYNWRTVQKWYLACIQETDPRLARARQRHDETWRAMPCRHGGTQWNCPSAAGAHCADFPELAERFARWSFEKTTFRDWFSS